jgi:hypothetical protein
MKPAQHKTEAMEALRELLGEPKLVGLRKKGRVWRGKAGHCSAPRGRQHAGDAGDQGGGDQGLRWGGGVGGRSAH